MGKTLTNHLGLYVRLFIMQFFRDLAQFIKDVAHDPRIPARDKKILLALVALIISPIDLIPDWIPIIGLLDDIILLAIVLDYFFEVLDSEILLSHYPWGMKSFTRVRRASRWVSRLTPNAIKDRIWKFEKSPYQ
jgi:uncharacterized membrane protein YkvA (DUF1232 family)